jgi:hypothetical protein
MTAKPLIPGYLYHVKGRGVDRYINAAHPCDAICIALNSFLL